MSALDSQLAKVADKISNVGSTTELKVGTLGGLKESNINIDKMADQMTRVGANLSSSLSSGMGVSNALLLSFAAKINALLDQMSSMMMTMFNRVDVAMKGHRWTNMMTGLSNQLGNFASGAGKKLSPLDRALGGAFGQNAKIGAAVFNTMFENLGKKMTEVMTRSAGEMTKEMGNAAKMIARIMISSMNEVSASVKALAATMSTSMLKSLETISVKLKDVSSSTARAMKGEGGFQPKGVYYGRAREPRAMKPSKEPIDIAEKIKPPSRTALKEYFNEIRRMAPELMKELSLDFQIKPKAPQRTMEFKGAIPDPALGKAFGSVMKDALSIITKIPEAIKQIPNVFNAAVASGNKFAIVAAGIAQGFIFVGQVAADVVVGVARIASGFLAMGLAAAAAIGRSISFFSTLGSVGSKSFAQLASGHNVFAAGLLVSTKLVYHLVRGLWDLVTLKAFRRVGDDAKFATSAVSKLGSSVVRLGTEIAAALGVVGLVYKVVQFFQGGVKAATELNATMIRTRLVFGDATAAVEAQAETLARATGVTKNAQLELAAGFGSMAQTAGLSEAASAALSNKLTALAVDMTALGIPMETSAEAIKTGLEGRAITLKQFGAAINEDTVKAQMLKNQLVGVNRVIAQLSATTQTVKPVAPAVGLAFGGQKKLVAEHARNQAQQTADQAKHLAIRDKNRKEAEQRALPKAQRVKPTAAAGPLVKPEAAGRTNELLARSQLIFQGLAYAQGAAAKVATSVGVQFQQAGGGVKMFAEKIGEMLLPALQAATTGFNAVMGSVLDMVSAAGPAIKSWGTESAGVITDFIAQTKEFGPSVLVNLTWLWDEAKKGPLGFVFEASEYLFDLAKMIPEMIGVGVRNMGTLWEIAVLKVGDFASNVVAIARTIPENFDRLWKWLSKNWKELLVDMIMNMHNFAVNIATNLGNLGKAIWNALRTGEFQFEWTDLTKNFQKTTEKLPELLKPALTSSQALIDEKFASIGEKELKRKKYEAAAVPDLTGKKPPPPEEKKSEYKLGGALEVGSKEAFSALSRNIAGKSSTTDAVKQGVSVAKDQLGVAKQQLAVMQGQAKMPALNVK